MGGPELISNNPKGYLAAPKKIKTFPFFPQPHQDLQPKLQGSFLNFDNQLKLLYKKTLVASQATL